MAACGCCNFLGTQCISITFNVFSRTFPVEETTNVASFFTADPNSSKSFLTNSKTFELYNSQHYFFFLVWNFSCFTLSFAAFSQLPNQLSSLKLRNYNATDLLFINYYKILYCIWRRIFLVFYVCDMPWISYLLFCHSVGFLTKSWMLHEKFWFFHNFFC